MTSTTPTQSLIVNKLEAEEDQSEFAVETLDTQTGGAAAANNTSSAVPNLSAATSNMSATENVNSLSQSNTNTNAGNTNAGNALSNMSNKSATASNTPNNTPPAFLSRISTNANNKSSTKSSKKSAKKQLKSSGASRKKQSSLSSGTATSTTATTALNNDVQPQVELGNDRGTMTIKYSSAKTVVPLYSTGNNAHLNLSELKSVFNAEYETVSRMTAAQLTELRHDMQNTEFDALGAEALVCGLLTLIDDHDTKKLTLKMMLARGLLKVNA